MWAMRDGVAANARPKAGDMLQLASTGDMFSTVKPSEVFNVPKSGHPNDTATNLGDTTLAGLRVALTKGTGDSVTLAMLDGLSKDVLLVLLGCWIAGQGKRDDTGILGVTTDFPNLPPLNPALLPVLMLTHPQTFVRKGRAAVQAEEQAAVAAALAATAADAARLKALEAARLQVAGGRKRGRAKATKALGKRAKLMRALAQLDAQPPPDSGSKDDDEADIDLTISGGDEEEFSMEAVKRLLAVQDRQTRQLVDNRTDNSVMTAAKTLRRFSQYVGSLPEFEELARYCLESVRAIVCPENIKQKT